TWPPEQARGGALDTRTDIFALGVVLYELTTGTRTFRGATPLETIASVLSDEPAPMARHRTGIPEALERVVRRMLAKNPAARLSLGGRCPARTRISFRRRGEHPGAS